MEMNKENIINLVESISKLTKENVKLYGILIDIVKELSVIYPNHEIETLPAKVKEVVRRLVKAEGIEALDERRKDEPAWKSWNWPMYTPSTPKDFKANEKLTKRHPTKEEALAQYHWLKENSTRNK